MVLRARLENRRRITKYASGTKSESFKYKIDGTPRAITNTTTSTVTKEIVYIKEVFNDIEHDYVNNMKIKVCLLLHQYTMAKQILVKQAKV